MNVFHVSLKNGAIGRITRGLVALTVLLWGMTVVFGMEIKTPAPPAAPSSPSSPELPATPNPPASPDQPQGVAEPSYPSVNASVYVGIGTDIYAPNDYAAPDTPATTPLDGPGNSYPACDPFAAFYGQHVLVHLENDTVLSGIMTQACQGFFTLEQFHINRTFAVNIAKILYVETTDAQ